MNAVELEGEPSPGDFPMDPSDSTSSERNERSIGIDTTRTQRSLLCGSETLKPIRTDAIHDLSLTHYGDFDKTGSGLTTTAGIDVPGTRRAQDVETPRESAHTAWSNRACDEAHPTSVAASLGEDNGEVVPQDLGSVTVQLRAANSRPQPNPHGASNGIPYEVRLELERLWRQISELRGEMERNQRFDDDESLPSYRA